MGIKEKGNEKDKLSKTLTTKNSKRTLKSADTKKVKKDDNKKKEDDIKDEKENESDDDINSDVSSVLSKPSIDDNELDD